jgi:hypothetical protein
MKEDIIRMAREVSGSMLHSGEFALFGNHQIERFAALVAARCADIAYEAEPWHSADLIREAFGVEK